LEALEQARAAARHHWEYPYSLERQVAKAAEISHPVRAIQLYPHQIKGLINRRGRDNYTKAAHILKWCEDCINGLEGKTMAFFNYPPAP
jgi:hypothetical protein